MLHERALEHHARGDLARATSNFARSLALFVEHAGPRHPDVANVAIDLACALTDRGRRGDHETASRLVRRAQRVLRSLSGDRDLDRLRFKALGQAAAIEVARGRYDRARGYQTEALAIARTELGRGELASALNALAMTCKYLGRYAEAGRLYARARALTRASRGPRRLALASLYHNIAGLEHARGRFARAEPVARRGLRLRVRALGETHLDVASDRAALAAILDGCGKDSEAEALYRGAIAGFARHLGSRHFEVGFNLANLAALHHKMGRYADARRTYTRALRILEGALGPRHPIVAGTLRNLGALWDERGRTAEAKRVMRRALRIYRATLGSAHPDTRDVLEWLEARNRRSLRWISPHQR